MGKLLVDMNKFFDDMNTFIGNMNTFLMEMNTFFGIMNTFLMDMYTFIGDMNKFKMDMNTFIGDMNKFLMDLNKSLRLSYFLQKETPPCFCRRRHLIYLLFGRFRFKSCPVVNSTNSELSFIGFLVLLLRWALALPSFFLPTHTISFLRNSLIVWMNSRRLIL